MKKYIIYFLLFILPIFLGCAAYQKTSVSIDKAEEKGKVKIVMKAGDEVKYDNINKIDSVYYGVNKERRKRLDATYEIIMVTTLLDENELESIYLTDIKNAVYGSIGLLPILGIGVPFTLSYERKILPKLNAGNNSYFVRGSFGGALNNLGEESFFLSQVGILHGKRAEHLEAAFGFITFYEYDNEFYPGWFIGFRHQKPDGGGVFRMGIGFPEGIYIGFGASF